MELNCPFCNETAEWNADAPNVHIESASKFTFLQEAIRAHWEAGNCEGMMR